MDAVRIGKTEWNGRPVIVVELFGVPLATASSEVMLTAYDTEPDFQERWSRYFREEIVSILAEKLHQERRVRGWLMATRLSPRPPDLPTEGEEG